MNRIYFMSIIMMVLLALLDIQPTFIGINHIRADIPPDTAVTSSEDTSPWRSPVPVIFEDVTYSAEQFNQMLDTVLEDIDLVLIPNENPELESPFLYAFTSVDSALEFLSKTRGIPSESPTHQHQPKVPIRIPGTMYHPQNSIGMYHSTFQFFENTNYGGSSLQTTYDLADLSVIGSNWENRISSVYNGGHCLLCENKNYEGTALGLWYWTDYPNLGIYGFNNRASSIDYYPFN
jgi:hypothetical protein